MPKFLNPEASVAKENITVRTPEFGELMPDLADPKAIHLIGETLQRHKTEHLKEDLELMDSVRETIDTSFLKPMEIAMTPPPKNTGNFGKFIQTIKNTINVFLYLIPEARDVFGIKKPGK